MTMALLFKKLKYFYFWVSILPYRFYKHYTGNYYVRRRIAGKKVMSIAETNDFLISKIQKGEPFMAGRFGSVECSIMYQYLQKKIGIRREYSEYIINAICKNAGFFPSNTLLIDDFSGLMLQSTKKVDLLANWNIREPYILNEYAKKSIRYCFLEDINPFFMYPQKPWTTALKGKKVLVIHPFTDTICKQYKIKDKLFPQNFMPDFDLITIKAVQTIAGEKDSRFNNWFEALDYMKSQMKMIEFDIAIIGCGAYGFPLAAYAKELGKQGIHLAGITQLLFGIKGRRWESSNYYKVNKFFNNYWVRPSESETPKQSNIVESGCYW